MTHPHYRFFVCQMAKWAYNLSCAMSCSSLIVNLCYFLFVYSSSILSCHFRRDYTKGIFQSIGFKEFHHYLTLPLEPSGGPAIEEEEKKALARGVEALKVTTRRYARKQMKWIKRRFLQITDRQVLFLLIIFLLQFTIYKLSFANCRKVPPVYGLDTTDVSQWDGQVRDLAFSIVDWFSNTSTDCDLSNGPVEPLALDSFTSSSTLGREEQTTFRCDQCDVVTIGRHQWIAHINSSRHRNVAKRLAKQQQKQQFQPD